MPLVIGNIITKSHIDSIICCFPEWIFFHFCKKFHFKIKTGSAIQVGYPEIPSYCLLASSRWLYHCKPQSGKS